MSDLRLEAFQQLGHFLNGRYLDIGTLTTYNANAFDANIAFDWTTCVKYSFPPVVALLFATQAWATKVVMCEWTKRRLQRNWLQRARGLRWSKQQPRMGRLSFQRLGRRMPPETRKPPQCSV